MADMVRQQDDIVGVKIGRSKHYDLRKLLIDSAKKTSTYGASLYSEDPHAPVHYEYYDAKEGDGKGNVDGNPARTYLGKGSAGDVKTSVGSLFLHSGPLTGEAGGGNATHFIPEQD